MPLQNYIRNNIPLLGLMFIIILMSFLNVHFLTIDNLLNILRQTSINAIIALGMTFVIITVGIDISVGSILALTGAMCASMISHDTPLLVALLLTMVLGGVIGATNGIIISHFNVQPFIATLVAMSILRGATMIFTDGRPISTSSNEATNNFYEIGGGYVGNIPIPVIITITLVLICWFVLHYTKFGRHVYATGGSEEVSYLAGIKIKRIKIWVYSISGFMSAIAGIILTSRLESAQPTAGVAYELDAIAAVILGGTSLQGRSGKIVGTLIGALIIGVLNNALNIMNITSYYQMIAKGTIILLAVIFDNVNNNKINN